MRQRHPRCGGAETAMTVVATSPTDLGLSVQAWLRLQPGLRAFRCTDLALDSAAITWTCWSRKVSLQSAYSRSFTSQHPYGSRRRPHCSTAQDRARGGYAA